MISIHVYSHPFWLRNYIHFLKSWKKNMMRLHYKGIRIETWGLFTNSIKIEAAAACPAKVFLSGGWSTAEWAWVRVSMHDPWMLGWVGLTAAYAIVLMSDEYELGGWQRRGRGCCERDLGVRTGRVWGRRMDQVKGVCWVPRLVTKTALIGWSTSLQRVDPQ